MKQHQLLTCIFLLLCLCSIITEEAHAASMLTNVAGGGSCDNGPATMALLHGPSGCVVDSIGNIYVSEYSANKIRKVDVNGIITTYVGTGSNTFNGDGLLALETNIYQPRGLSYVESSHELFFSDEIGVIRKVLSNGTVVIVAGDGKNGFVDNVEPTKGQLSAPRDVAVYPNGDLLIADYWNYKVRKVSNGTISTIAGSTLVLMNNDLEGIDPKSAHIVPRSVTISPFSGETYIGDSSKAMIRKIKANDNRIYSIPNTDRADSVRFNSLGEIVYNNAETSEVKKVLTNGTVVKIAGTGTYGYNGDNILATSASLFNPVVCIDPKSDAVLIADTTNNRLRKILTNGTIITIAGNGESSICDGTALDSAINDPKKLVSIPGTSDILLIDSHRVRLFSNNTISTVVGGSSGFLDNVLATSGQLSDPADIAVTPDGSIIIADTTNNRIRMVSKSTGNITTIAGTGAFGFNGNNMLATDCQLSNPNSVAIHSKTGEIYIADTNNHRIRKILTNGTIITIAGDGQSKFQGDNGPAIMASLKSPSGVAVNSDTDEVYIADTNNHRIRKILTNGTIITILGDGASSYSGDGRLASASSIGYPIQVLLDKVHDEIYIVSNVLFRVFKISSNGKVYTVAGRSSSPTFNGNNLSPLSSGLRPSGVALSSDLTTLYIADTENNFLRSIKLYRCNSTPPEDERVCNGHGSCIDQDVCICNVGYNGTFCNEIPCFGSLGKSGCSENGECVAVDVCNCLNGWIGLNCSVPTCFGIPANDSNVCNGNGTCLSVDNCKCNEGLTELDCAVSNLIDNSTMSGNSTFTNQTIVGNSTLLGNNTIANNTIVDNSTLIPGNTTVNNTTVDNSTQIIVNNTVTNNRTEVSNNTTLNNNTTVDNSTRIIINNTLTNNTNRTEVSNNTINNTTVVNNNTLVSNNTIITNSTTQSNITCYDISFNSSNVCSGRGVCLSFNNCSCYQGYYGLNCESERKVSVVPSNNDGNTNLGIILGTILGSTCLMITCLVALGICFKVISSKGARKSKNSNTSIEMNSNV